MRSPAEQRRLIGVAVLIGTCAARVSPPDGDSSSLSVTDASTGEVVVELSDEVMVLLAGVQGGLWDGKWSSNGRSFPPVGGRITFIAGITREIE